MIVNKNFKLLKFTQMQRKESKDIYFVISLLDDENNPVKFYVFDANLVNTIISNMQKFKPLQDICLDIDFVFNNNIWNAKVINLYLLETDKKGAN